MLRSLAVAVAAGTLMLVGCNGDPPSPEPSPSVPTTAPTLPTPTETVPSYLEDLTEEERAAYSQAVEDYEDFADRQAGLYADGRATPEARRFYQERSAAWQSYWARLMDYENRGIRIVGRGETLRVRPGLIRLGEDGGGQIDLRVCGVATNVRVFQDGEEVEQPEPEPVVTRVAMIKMPDETVWKVLFQRVGKSC